MNTLIILVQTLVFHSPAYEMIITLMIDYSRTLGLITLETPCGADRNLKHVVSLKSGSCVGAVTRRRSETTGTVIRSVGEACWWSWQPFI